MSAHTPPHVCSDADCCYRGQPSSTSCRCHKPAPQMMREQIDALVKALEGLLPWLEDAETKCLVGDEGCVWAVEHVRDILASVGGARDA